MADDNDVAAPAPAGTGTSATPASATGATGPADAPAEAGGAATSQPAEPASPDPSPTSAEIMSRIARDAEEGAGGRSADRMADRLIDDLSADPKLAGNLERSPELVREFADVAKLTADAAILRQYDLEIIKSNGKLYLTVVVCVGASLLIVVVSIFVIAVVQLAMMGPTLTGTITIAVPDGLIALGSAAIGALAGLLTPLTGRR
ncbi:hypothetical protein MWN33_15795 [Starkeya koreensis]|uniref:Uncharacterized protein n=1 Tax=Ancylobacter koreensis TaxID=266121 RepID=A0ABT0DQE2_9HYPH|nr:hypothetical protein [Ancylobacter koreensis]MCK0209495.1 hypothetical protein [Ancylobacter koreensis]